MHSKNVALAVLASALLSTTAFAQSSPPASSPADTKSPPAATQPAKPPTSSSMETKPSTSSSMEMKAAPTTAMGQWRASKFVGLDVYNANNEKIGDINEILFDSSGKIGTVVIGVGGFLGIGEHDVGLPFEQVKFVNEPVKSTTGTSKTGTGTTTTTTTTTANKDFPDHAMVNMTKEQLKALPAFKYASDTSSASTTRTTTSPAPASPPAKAPMAPANQAK
jgi:sporulation protein YlmC with PRC-barrel domain